jgi:5'-3' exonuclease
MKDPRPDWLFVDGSSFIFRAFHGVPLSVRAPDGHLVNAVRGFMETLVRLIGDRRPRRVAVADDADWRPAWRVELIPGYKAHRTAEPVPPELEPQMPIVRAFLDAVGVDFVGVPGYEAEDVIAAWTSSAPGTMEIASGDRDLFALVEDPRIRVLYPERAGLAVVDEADVSRRYGIPGRSYADFAILRGDPSDGLPGLKGVGAVAAAALVRAHGGVPGVIRDGRLSDADRDYLTRALQVVTPARQLEIPLPAGRRQAYPADPAALDALGEAHGVKATADRLLHALAAAVARDDPDS